MMNRFLLSAWIVFLGTPAMGSDKNVSEKFRYLRPTSTGTTTECIFTIRGGAEGWSIQSITERGKGRLDLTAAFDRKNRLTSAEVAWILEEKGKKAKVSVAGGKARVQREGKDAQEFDVPAGVIVTSAPDWTDTFLLCRRYDRRKAGKQSFPGLWIHPLQDARRLTFHIERTGSGAIEHAGKKLVLDRFLIRLRNNSGYAAWADEKGLMIKLHALPFRAGTDMLVLEGFEKSAATLRVP
jgi:hypothetical protein